MLVHQNQIINIVARGWNCIDFHLITSLKMCYILNWWQDTILNVKNKQFLKVLRCKLQFPLVCKQNKWVVYPISFSYSQLTRENSYSSFFNVLMWNKPIIYKSQNNTNNKLEWMHFADFGMMCMETKRNKIFPLMI